MSYAIETKKRKFDRILESLAERPAQPDKEPEPRTSSSSHSNASTSIRESLDASKRRRVTPTLSKSTSHSSLVGYYLPSSRPAFLERLETFRHVTKWHIPSTITISAAEWAKRGWFCADVDSVCCGQCLERVAVDLSVEKRPKVNHESENEEQDDQGNTEEIREGAEEEDSDMAVEIYDALVRRYRDMITTAHGASCPWRKRGCDTSIQRIEGLLNTSGAIASTKERLAEIAAKIENIPPVTDLPSFDDLPAPRIQDLQELELGMVNTNALKLAMSGWQYKEADVVECRHCFRSLGLWLYRGEAPIIQHLDAVESHLDYCPWSSAEAQDTELMIHHQVGSTGGKKLKLPGWALIYHAMKKQTLKKRGISDRPPSSSLQIDGVQFEQEQLSPEQREKKLKDLMRRIKEIKKPFNVRALLRKKDRPET